MSKIVMPDCTPDRLITKKVDHTTTTVEIAAMPTSWVLRSGMDSQAKKKRRTPGWRASW
ncbi:MAG: hypothetical protein VW999_13975 [Alphaproteobacteria bacterium]